MAIRINKTGLYKAVVYQPNKNSFETRYRIVSTATGKVLDDAQGYGYKTAQKAHAAYAYKKRKRIANGKQEKPHYQRSRKNP